MNLYIWLFYFWLFISSISYTESNEADEKVQVKSQDEDLGRGCELLTWTLIELKAARKQEERRDKDNEKQGSCRSLAVIIDRAFFVLYFFSSLSFLVFMYLAWVKWLNFHLMDNTKLCVYNGPLNALHCSWDWALW